MISPKNTLIGLLAGASVLALAAVSPSYADGTILSGESGPVTVVDDTDFILVDGTFTNELDPGDVTNEAIVGGSAPAAIGLQVDPSAIINGNLVNGSAGEIFALSTSTPTASATGISLDGAVVTSVINSGLVDVLATASAPSATASARGLVQSVGGASLALISLTNDGTISASAAALASGSAAANATGVDMFASGSVGYDIVNTNLISARATASGNAAATAVARGIALGATGTASGSFTNSGRIEAIASAVTEAGASLAGLATATGVSIASDGLTDVITNTGVVIAQASGVAARATGITIAGVSSGSFVNDGGTIEATVFDATGQSRGIAIEVQDTSNAIMTLDLKGAVADGHIVGDVVIGDGDVINVTEGNTYLTGDIASSGTGGDLNINSGGALWLQHGGATLGGPSIVTVANYEQLADGTVAIGVDPDGTSSRVNGDGVDLAGNMVVQMNAGLYEDIEQYNDVVTSGSPITGTWDLVSSLSPLMTAEVVYNTTATTNSIDLFLTRTAFDAVDGLTRNQGSVAAAFENAYMDPENSVAFNAVTGELFTLDAAGYAAALDDLSGIEHAVAGQQVMRSFRNMDAALAGVQDRDCDSGSGSYATSQVQGGNVITPVADLDVVDCNGGSLWLRGQGLWANASNTSNSPGFDETEWSIYGGADYTLSTGTTLGMMIGYVNADIDFDGGSDAGFDGYQVGVYGQQSWDAFYLQGLVAYGNMDVDVHRDIVVGDIAGTSRSNYDDAVWYVNGEMGYSWGMGLDWDATPYAGLSYASLNGDGFNEGGLEGADLSGGVDGESLVSALGVRLAADWGNTTNYWRPELSLAWEHEFGDFTTLDASFIGAPASSFSVTGGDYGRDAAVVEAGFAYGWEGMEFKLNYAGRWTADYDDQAVYGQFTARF